jgi:mxaJ protein
MRMPLRACAAVLVLATACALSAHGVRADDAERVLRVCADPNNLPYSNEALEGFENRLAQTVASDMHAKVEYTWWAQRRGLVGNTFQANKCDVVLGVAGGDQQNRTTRPK